MRMRTIQFLVLSAAVAALLTGCSRSGAPPRPGNVPTTAVWAGQTNHGVFITCSVDRMMNANPCTVYNDRTGRVEASGLYVLRSSGTAAASSDLRYVGFDGKRMFLEGGKVLEPMQAQAPAQPPAASEQKP